MKKTVRIQTAELAYEVFGEGPVELVIEMGLGACAAEWRQLAQRLCAHHAVLVYSRAGYGASSASGLTRTPEHVAKELYDLLCSVDHTAKLMLLGHSQGGLYAYTFAKNYPALVKKLVLLDPLSPADLRFAKELTADEYRKSGADKTAGLTMGLRLCRLHLGWLVRMMMTSAPPFYYYAGFDRTQRKEILAGLGNERTYETALAEYQCAHDGTVMQVERGCLGSMSVVLVTHSTDIAAKEIQDFGGADEATAQKIESLWQEIMGVYLESSSDAVAVRAEHSSHYIHLTDADLVCSLFA